MVDVSFLQAPFPLVVADTNTRGGGRGGGGGVCPRRGMWGWGVGRGVHLTIPDSEVFPVAIMGTGLKGKGGHPNGVGPIESVEGEVVDLHSFYAGFLVEHLLDDYIQRHLIQLTLYGQHHSVPAGRVFRAVACAHGSGYA